MEQSDKSDTDVRRAMQIESLKHDLSKALKLNELVVMYLRAGTDPKYIAYRFGVDLERCERYVAALNKQKEQQREREESARGDSEVPEIGKVANGS